MLRISVLEQNTSFAQELQEKLGADTAIVTRIELNQLFLPSLADVLVLDASMFGAEECHAISSIKFQNHELLIIGLLKIPSALVQSDWGHIYLPHPIKLRSLEAIIQGHLLLAQSHGSQHWTLHQRLKEIKAPCGRQMALSHSEYQVLFSAASCQPQVVSRKALIEALGAEYLQYDERRLETLISRLRKKLTGFSDHPFPIRAIKGKGYLFASKLQIT